MPIEQSYVSTREAGAVLSRAGLNISARYDDGTLVLTDTGMSLTVDDASINLCVVTAFTTVFHFVGYCIGVYPHQPHKDLRHALSDRGSATDA